MRSGDNKPLAETQEDNICWLILKASLGEFHVIVPELLHFSEQEGLKLHITFVSGKIEKKFFDNLLYRNLAEQYFKVVQRKDLLRFAKSNRNKIKYLFRDVSEMSKFSVTRSLKIMLPNTKLVMFPHAFAFYVSKLLSNYQTVIIPPENKYEDCVDAFITFTEEDKKYFSKRFPISIITVFTPRGLGENWLQKIQGVIPEEEVREFHKKFPKRVLLTIRHPHRIYLSEENYYKLLQEVIEVTSSFGYELFIKPHPRQNMDEFLSYCKTRDLHVWTKDTYTSALFFDRIITFWSSASIDFAAFGIPSIEHFRYEKYHNQLVRKDGKLSSIYVNMGLSLPSSNKAELKLAFEKVIKDPEGVGKEQQNNLLETYYSPSLNLNNMTFRKPAKFSFLDRLVHYARLQYYVRKNE